MNTIKEKSASADISDNKQLSGKRFTGRNMNKTASGFRKVCLIT